MGLQKGQTNNPKGRPKGQPNKLTAEVKDVLKGIVQNELEQLPTTLAGLEPKDRAEILAKLLPYILPKAAEQPTPPAKQSRPPIEWVDTTEAANEPLNIPLSYWAENQPNNVNLSKAKIKALNEQLEKER